MEYVALFVWLLVCLVLGGVINAILQSAHQYKLVALLAAPGMVARKFAMTAVGLLSGATVTQVNIYDLSERDIGFEAKGIPGISKMLVPLAPLFVCAVVLQGINVALGSPLSLSFRPPPFSSLDATGLRGFMFGLWDLMSGLFRQIVDADWGSGRLYLLLAFIFSLSLGACVPFAKFREGFLGIAFLAGGLAALCALLGVRSGAAGAAVAASSPAARWGLAARSFVMGTAGMAFIMMLCGLMAGVVGGVLVRLFELAGKGSRGAGASGSKKASKSSETADKKRMAA